MSGGVAYVLDLDRRRVNRELVDLEPPAEEDLKLLRDVLTRHQRLTGSPLAAALLAEWSTRAGSFTKIMPRDYRRVLEAADRARTEDRDPDTVIMEAVRA
jgi:glutamate synthase (NADPH/NADH) large chain